MLTNALLIYPPHTRNTEPPLGLALLASALDNHGLRVRCLDLNSQCGPALATETARTTFSSTRSRRAARHLKHAINHLRSPDAFSNYARYRTSLESYARMLREAAPDQWNMNPGDLRYSEQDDFSSKCCEDALYGSLLDPFAKLTQAKITKTIATFLPDFIGISLSYRSQLIPGLALISYLRRELPRIPLTLGGSLLTTLPDSILNLLKVHVDLMVIGPGESALLTFAGIEATFHDCPSVAGDFKTFDVSTYFSPGTVIPFRWSRGCYWNTCAFCMEGVHPYRCADISQAFSGLELLRDDYHPSLFHFTDNAIPPKILKELSTRSLGVPWYGFVRPESNLTDRDFVQALARSGCVMLQLGMETPVQRLLDFMKKGTCATDYSCILENLRAVGIRSYVYLLFGLPTETHEDRTENLQFASSHPIDYLNASLFRLPKGSNLASNPDEYGIHDVRPRSDDSHYMSFRGEDEQRKVTRRWLSETFAGNGTVRTILSQTPPYYKSNHAAYFSLMDTTYFKGRAL